MSQWFALFQYNFVTPLTSIVVLDSETLTVEKTHLISASAESPTDLGLADDVGAHLPNIETKQMSQSGVALDEKKNVLGLYNKLNNNHF